MDLNKVGFIKLQPAFSFLLILLSVNIVKAMTPIVNASVIIHERIENNIYEPRIYE